MDRKLNRVLLRLWKSSRFTSYFYQNCDFISSAALPTLALGVRAGKGIALYYNPAFTATLTDSELTGLLIHEMLHPVLSHDHRGLSGEDSLIRNIAQDMAVNAYIEPGPRSFFSINDPEMKPALPRGALGLPRKFYSDTGNRDPAWEDIYRWLKGLREGGGSDPSDGISLEMADMTGAPGGGRNSSKAEPDDNAGFFTTTPSMTMKGPDGTPLPAGIHLALAPPDTMKLDAAKERVLAFASRDEEASGERIYSIISGMIKRVEPADTDEWVNRLRSLTDLVSRSSEWVYTHSRFNRRYSAQGIYTAGRMLKEKYIVTVAVDVSASVMSRPGVLEKAFGGIESLLKKYTIELICLDEQLFVPKKDQGLPARELNPASRFRYSKGDWKQIKTGSGGATFFAPLFNSYMNGHKEALIVITDGRVYDLHQLKRYTPTLWVITSEDREPFTPPFGRVIKMDSKK